MLQQCDSHSSVTESQQCDSHSRVTESHQHDKVRDSATTQQCCLYLARSITPARASPTWTSSTSRSRTSTGLTTAGSPCTFPGGRETPTNVRITPMYSAIQHRVVAQQNCDITVHHSTVGTAVHRVKLTSLITYFKTSAYKIVPICKFRAGQSRPQVLIWRRELP